MKIISLLLLLVCSDLLLAQTGKHRPNIIFILADDLGYGDVGCYGQKKIHTPNIDRMAKKGIRFLDFYSGSTVCAPARSTFMTGKHTGHTAIRGNITLKPEGQVPLPDSVVTIAQLLQQQGYETAAFGKWSLGFVTSSGDPQKKGFDEFYGYNCQTLAHNYYPDHLWHNHERVDLSGNLRSDSAYSADLIHAQAMRFLRQPHNRPFFLYLPYTLPHADVIAPHDSVYEFYKNTFHEQAVSIPRTKGDGEQHHFDPYPHAAFAAMVSRLDRFVGEIMDLVDRKGWSENTLIIFTSDNGPHRENGGDPDFFDSNGEYRGIKRDLYEGGIREPFIAYQKNFTKPGAVSTQAFALWDLFPSFLSLAGAPATKNTDGISLIPALTGKNNQPSHDYLYWELHEAGGKQAVLKGEWKLILLDVSKGKPAVELYNLKNDPGEKNNLAASLPSRVQQLQSLMNEAHVPSKEWPLLIGE